MRDNSTLDQGVSTEMEGSRLVNDDFYEVRDLIGHFSELMNIIRSLVMERRKIKKEDFKDIATGKIFVGKQALESSLVDKIGDELDAN